MSVYRQALAELTNPGGRFEVIEEEIGGIRQRTFAVRPTHLRFLIERAERHADREFLVQGDVRLTFGEAMQQARRLGAALRERFGVEPGSRVGLLGSNAPEWVVAFWAAMVIDAIAVPFNAWWAPEELAFGLADSDTQVLFTDTRRSASALEAGAQPGQLIVWGEGGPPAGSVRLADLLEAAPLGTDEVEPRGEDSPAGIFYTSGTTGRPKGSANTHRNIIANLLNVRAFFRAVGETPPRSNAPREARRQDSDLTVIPLFHATALLSTMIPYLHAGHRLVFMPPGRFDPEVAGHLIEAERISRFGGVPTVVNRIIESGAPDRYDFSSVRSISYGGAPASPALLEKIGRAFPALEERVVQGYGLTETSPLLTLNVGADYFSHPDSVGVALPTVELKIANEAGVPLPVGETGEIWARGSNVIPGYWRRPDDNLASFVDGYFRTGDIGRLDESGFLYITDRAKDVIIRGGENVYCAEVEAVLEAHPAIAEAAVIGVPHPDWGEEVKAIVVPGKGDVDTDQVAMHVAAHLASFKVPSLWEVRQRPLPRNPAGKVLKSSLRTGDTAVSGVADDTDSAL